MKSKGVHWMAAVCLLGAAVGAGQAQEKRAGAESAPYSRKHTFTVFAEYAPTSEHILAGASRQRKVASLGFGYSYRVVRFLGTELSFHAEVRPVVFESDPMARVTGVDTVTDSTGAQNYPFQSTSVTFAKCTPSSGSEDYKGSNGTTEHIQWAVQCGRQWTFGQAFSPAGFKYNFRTHHALQPYAIGTLGYMYTSRPVPMPEAEGFNYLINAGAGVELYRKGKQSVAAECRLSHFSNWDTAAMNPGTDQVVYSVAYSFGR